MSALDGRADRIYAGLSARERAILILEATHEGLQPRMLVRLEMREDRDQLPVLRRHSWIPLVALLHVGEYYVDRFAEPIEWELPHRLAEFGLIRRVEDAPATASAGEELECFPLLASLAPPCLERLNERR